MSKFYGTEDSNDSKVFLESFCIPEKIDSFNSKRHCEDRQNISRTIRRLKAIKPKDVYEECFIYGLIERCDREINKKTFVSGDLKRVVEEFFFLTHKSNKE